MIDRIEFANVFVPDQALAITFFYDSGCTDTFTVFDSLHAHKIMMLAETNPEPEAVLVIIRDLGTLTLH